MKAKSFLLALLFFTYSVEVRTDDYIIYSIVGDLPMGHPKEVLKKNFYVNIGKNQGVEKGAVLDVYRNVSRLDAYSTKKRFNYSVKIGELEVLHSQGNSSIGYMIHFNEDEKYPLFETKAFMIGDKVNVKIDD